MTDWEIIKSIMERVRPPRDVWEVIEYTYAQGYDRICDGNTIPFHPFPQLNFDGLKLKHPVGNGHDGFYREGRVHPLLPRKYRRNDFQARSYADWWYGRGLHAFGCEWFGRATAYPLILRGVGWWAYDRYRDREREGDFRHILNPVSREMAKRVHDGEGRKAK